MATSTDITSALITYGLISTANKNALAAWFTDLFTQVQGGGGGELLSSSIAGRTFTFAPGLSVHDAFAACARALEVLNGRTASRTYGRF